MDVAVNANHIDLFQSEGAVVLRNVFSQDWLEKIANGIAHNRQYPSQKYSQIVKTPDRPGEYFNDKCQWPKFKEISDFVLNSPAAEIAAKLMKSKTATLFHDHVLVKDPGAYPVTSWHQDQPYYPVDGNQTCSIWIPVDPVVKEVSLQFVKGSHTWGKWFHPQNFATKEKYPVKDNNFYGKIYHDLPVIDGSDEYDILQWNVNPGDCVAFHMLSLHQAPGNTTDIPRRVLSVRWFGDDVVFARRPWDCHPDELGGCCVDEHPHGDLFPLVWSAK